LVVETKTSDNFTIDLHRLAEYRRLLPVSMKLGEEDSSVLLVLGRQDTGDYEDRIKGSRYAFVMRVITVDALLRLLASKEAIEDEGARANFSARILELFTSPKVIALDAVVDIIAEAPLSRIPSGRHRDYLDRDGEHKKAADRVEFIVRQRGEVSYASALSLFGRHGNAQLFRRLVEVLGRPGGPIEVKSVGQTRPRRFLLWRGRQG
jgi:hypothetical protein